MPPNALMHRLSAEKSTTTDLLPPEVHRLLVFPATELEIITKEPLLTARTRTPPSCHRPSSVGLALWDAFRSLAPLTKSHSVFLTCRIPNLQPPV